MKTEELMTNAELALLPENQNLHEFCMLGDYDDVYSEYSDAYKSVHGIRARWAYGWERESLFTGFLHLREDAIWQAGEEERQLEEDKYWADPRNNRIEKPEWIPADKYEAMAGEPL